MTEFGTSRRQARFLWLLPSYSSVHQSVSFDDKDTRSGRDCIKNHKESRNSRNVQALHIFTSTFRSLDNYEQLLTFSYHSQTSKFKQPLAVTNFVNQGEDTVSWGTF